MDTGLSWQGCSKGSPLVLSLFPKGDGPYVVAKQVLRKVQTLKLPTALFTSPPLIMRHPVVLVPWALHARHPAGLTLHENFLVHHGTGGGNADDAAGAHGPVLVFAAFGDVVEEDGAAGAAEASV